MEKIFATEGENCKKKFISKVKRSYVGDGAKGDEAKGDEAKGDEAKGDKVEPLLTTKIVKHYVFKTK